MSTALLESPLSLFAEPRRSRRPAGGRELTLEERLEGALRAVRAHGQAECPVWPVGDARRWRRRALLGLRLDARLTPAYT